MQPQFSLAIYRFAVNSKWLEKIMCSWSWNIIDFFFFNIMCWVGYTRCRSALLDHTHAFGRLCKIGTKQHMSEMVSINVSVKLYACFPLKYFCHIFYLFAWLSMLLQTHNFEPRRWNINSMFLFYCERPSRTAHSLYTVFIFRHDFPPSCSDK